MFLRGGLVRKTFQRLGQVHLETLSYRRSNPSWYGGLRFSGNNVNLTSVKDVFCIKNEELSRGLKRFQGSVGMRGGGGGSDGNRRKNVDCKKLMIRMKEAKSAEEFVNVLDRTLDGPIFDHFLASASYHRLAFWKRNGKLLAGDKTKLLLDRLNHRVKGMVAKDELDAQACANVLWSIAHLSDALTNALDVVPAMAAQIPLKAKDLKPQELSNILWASANLKDDAPVVLSIVPAMAAQIKGKAKDMVPQALCNILWASANLKGDAPVVLSIVPAMAARIKGKAKDLDSQALSNILWASANLKDDAPDLLSIVPATAAQIPLKAKDMNPQELSNILWASANLKDDAPDVLSIVPAMAAQIPLKAKDMVPQALCNILWASANLKDDAPVVLSIVPAMAAQIKGKAKDMNLQDFSQAIIGLLSLQELVPEARSFLDDAGGREDEFVRQAIMRTPKLIPKERNRDVVVLTLPVILWACVRLELHSVPEVPQLLGSMAEWLGSRKQVSRLNLGACVCCMNLTKS